MREILSAYLHDTKTLIENTHSHMEVWHYPEMLRNEEENIKAHSVKNYFLKSCIIYVQKKKGELTFVK